ncbi:hypothetical protein [Nonomuraea coxensis]|uniref:hypothetical protein n=1 Tax=Nonomuraea coxensis TaxID=404386 RepID=UPI000370C582|nr:hypothetical protein [Nonomuraea coxensis]
MVALVLFERSEPLGGEDVALLVGLVGRASRLQFVRVRLADGEFFALEFLIFQPNAGISRIFRFFPCVTGDNANGRVYQFPQDQRT